MSTFEVGTIEELDAPEASYDAVLGLSILHLLEDWEGSDREGPSLAEAGRYFRVEHVLRRTTRWVFSSTSCRSRAFSGVCRMSRSSRRKQLLDSLTNAGFEIDHEWQPGKRKAVFIVATKR